MMTHPIANQKDGMIQTMKKKPSHDADTTRMMVRRAKLGANRGNVTIQMTTLLMNNLSLEDGMIPMTMIATTRTSHESITIQMTTTTVIIKNLVDTMILARKRRRDIRQVFKGHKTFPLPNERFNIKRNSKHKLWWTVTEWVKLSIEIRRDAKWMLLPKSQRLHNCRKPNKQNSIRDEFNDNKKKHTYGNGKRYKSRRLQDTRMMRLWKMHNVM
jgi:hypothetical protein